MPLLKMNFSSSKVERRNLNSEELRWCIVNIQVCKFRDHDITIHVVLVERVVGECKFHFKDTPGCYPYAQDEYWKTPSFKELEIY